MRRHVLDHLQGPDLPVLSVPSAALQRFAAGMPSTQPDTARWQPSDERTPSRTRHPRHLDRSRHAVAVLPSRGPEQLSAGGLGQGTVHVLRVRK